MLSITAIVKQCTRCVAARTHIDIVGRSVGQKQRPLASHKTIQLIVTRIFDCHYKLLVYINLKVLVF